MSSITRYVPTTTPTPAAAPADLVVSALDVARLAANGQLRPRALQQLTARLDAAKFAAGHLEQVQQIISRVARESATCARDLASLRADIAEHNLRRVVAEFQNDQLEAERTLLPTRVEERDALAKLQHRIAKARLLAELRDVRQDAPRVPASPRAASATPNLDIERAAATRERALTDARRIVEDVIAEHVPTDARQPHHAFAGCVYLAARLDGATPADAAAHTRTVVADRIAAGTVVTPHDRLAHKAQYEQLKTRMDAASKKRENAIVLATLEHFGLGNGSGGAQ